MQVKLVATVAIIGNLRYDDYRLRLLLSTAGNLRRVVLRMLVLPQSTVAVCYGVLSEELA